MLPDIHVSRAYTYVARMVSEPSVLYTIQVHLVIHTHIPTHTHSHTQGNIALGYVINAYGKVELKLNSSLNYALMEVSGQLHLIPALPLAIYSPVPTERQFRWAPAPLWIFWRQREFRYFCESNHNSSTISPVAYILYRLSYLGRQLRTQAHKAYKITL